MAAKVHSNLRCCVIFNFEWLVLKTLKICISKENNSTGAQWSTFLCLAKEIKYTRDLYVCFFANAACLILTSGKAMKAKIPNLEKPFSRKKPAGYIRIYPLWSGNPKSILKVDKRISLISVSSPAFGQTSGEARAVRNVHWKKCWDSLSITEEALKVQAAAFPGKEMVDGPMGSIYIFKIMRTRNLIVFFWRWSITSPAKAVVHISASPGEAGEIYLLKPNKGLLWHNTTSKMTVSSFSWIPSAASHDILTKIWHRRSKILLSVWKSVTSRYVFGFSHLKKGRAQVFSS